MRTDFFNVEVKPTFTGANCVTAFANGDVLFDWTEFQVPRGTSNLLGITMVVRGTNGVRQEQALDIYFATDKFLNSKLYAPGSIGTVNDTSDGNAYYEHITGTTRIVTDDYNDGFDVIAAAHKDLSNGINIGGLPHTGSTAGVDRLYIAGIARGAFDFGTGVTLNQGSGQAQAESETSLTISGSADKALQIGDVLQAADGASIGSVVSIDGATMRVSAVAEALANTDEIVNTQPLRFILHFSK